ncbi:MAG TPA: alpha/beta hydrolase [Kofleriaceae bacterium]|nr:alpha/beta hydrolase [Kofleriaceae bacterium]
MFRGAAVLVVLALGCGGSRPEPEKPTRSDDDHGPFGRDADFEPAAFGVEVHGEGRPVILIPGLGCPGEVWNDTVEHFGDGYQTHVLTLSGFAGRPAIKEPLSAATRRDITRYIRSRRLDHPIIIGHSMGGFIAYWLASYHPELTGPVIVVDAGPALSGDEDEAKQLRSKWRHVSEQEFANLTRIAFASMTRYPKKMASVIERVAESDQRAFADAIYEMVTTDLTDEVDQIKAPVLILAADGGLQKRIRAQVESIPDHTMIVLPKTKHFVMFDDPERFFDEIDKFLDDHPG